MIRLPRTGEARLRAPARAHRRLRSVVVALLPPRKVPSCAPVPGVVMLRRRKQKLSFTPNHCHKFVIYAKSLLQIVFLLL